MQVFKKMLGLMVLRFWILAAYEDQIGFTYYLLTFGSADGEPPTWYLGITGVSKVEVTFPVVLS